jgi:hypothetical protein
MLPLRRTKRDQRLKRLSGRVRRIAPHLASEIAFAPLIQSFARVSLLLNDAYEVLRVGPLTDPVSGELRASVDVVRRLAETQLRFAERLGLTPATLKQFKREKRVDFAGALAGDDDESESEE